MALTRRTSTATLKKSKEAPEPDTFLCKGSETVATEKDREPLLGKCKECPNNSNSEVDHLCLNCHNEAAGLEFDEDKKRFVKRKGRK